MLREASPLVHNVQVGTRHNPAKGEFDMIRTMFALFIAAALTCSPVRAQTSAPFPIP